jgi:hypothetical protein
MNVKYVVESDTINDNDVLRTTQIKRFGVVVLQ